MNKKELTAPCGLDCFNCGWFEENLTDEIRENEAKQANRENAGGQKVIAQLGHVYRKKA